MAELGVNIDHVATVREARKTNEPDPAWAATLAQLGGADAITLHLREDRRHIQERDLRILIQTVTVPVNLELAAQPDVLAIAIEAHPYQVTLVPERREEVTTEGGLDVIGQRDLIKQAVEQLQQAGIVVSLFLDPTPDQIQAGIDLGVHAIEIHTGAYAAATAKFDGQKELQQVAHAAELVRQGGLLLHAGHGLTYRNVRPIAEIPGMKELNIGHSIIARAIMVGLEQAVRDMKRLVDGSPLSQSL